MHLIDVDPVCLQAFQGIFNLPLYAGCRGVTPDLAMIVTPVQRNLCSQGYLVPPATGKAPPPSGTLLLCHFLTT